MSSRKLSSGGRRREIVVKMFDLQAQCSRCIDKRDECDEILRDALKHISEEDAGKR